MTEVTIATLLVSGAVLCWRGWRQRHPDAERTIELHSGDVLYCFDEPRNSMTKNLKERISLRGAHVIDCGTHRGRLCFGIEVSSACCIEQPHHTGKFSFSLASASAAPSTNARSRVALFFTSDKLLKWRFICLLRRAAQHVPDTLPSACGDAALEWNADIRGIYRQLNRPPRIIDESGDEPIEAHDVEQLADVLQLYEAQRQGQQCTEGHGAQPQDRRAYSETEQWTEAEQWNGAVVPERLAQSPLFALCIAKCPANQLCADCGAAWPTWAVLQPVGGFVCILCVGVHRQLWPQKCRELRLDRWSADDIAFMAGRGNEIVNGELEYGGYESADELYGTVYKPIQSQSPHALRERFIRFKYNGFFSRERHGATQMERVLPPLDPGTVGFVAFATKSITSPCASADLHSEEEPMRYIGVAYVTVKEIRGIRSKGAVIALTNGFQEVRSRPAISTESNNTNKEFATSNNRSSSSSSSHHCTRWDESFQLGIHSAAAPLHVALYSSADELLGVAEWALLDGTGTAGEPRHITVPLIWWTGSEAKRRMYGIFATRRDNTSSTGNGEIGTPPSLHLIVSFGHFG